MPIYVYRYSNKRNPRFGQTFEVFQSVHDEPLKVCPKTRCKVERVPQSFMGRLATHLRPEAEQMNARQALYLERPDVQEKIRKGILVPDTSQGDND